MITTQYDKEPLPAQGLSDGGHLILECSNCNKKLVDIWITKPQANFDWEAEAQCCFCGDKSFVKKFHGGFSYSGFCKEMLDGDDYESYTKVLTPQIANGKIVFPTAKGDKQ